MNMICDERAKSCVQNWKTGVIGRVTLYDTTFPISQSERAAVANENKADAPIRVFANSSDDTTVGASAVCMQRTIPTIELFSSSFRLSDVIINTFCDKTAQAGEVWMG